MAYSSAWLRDVRGAVDGFKYGGFDLNWIDLRQTAPPHLPPAFFDSRLQFAVRFDKAPVGEISAAIHRMEKGADFHIGRLFLLPAVQNQGFAGALQQHLDRCLPALGFGATRLDSSGAGSYAWARLGYDFDLNIYRRRSSNWGLPDSEILRRARAGLLKGPTPHEWRIAEECGGGVVPPAASNSVQVMLHLLSQVSQENSEVVAGLVNQLNGAKPGDLHRPGDIALFGREMQLEGIRAGSWLGREVMIRSIWSGIRPLGPA